MTEFATHALLGSPTASLVGKDKGDVSNRVKCAGAQLVNNAKNVATDVVVIGGTTFAAGAVLKNKKIAERLSKIMAKAITPLKAGFGVTFKKAINSPAIKKCVDTFKSAPGMYGRALALVMAIGLGTISLVNRKHNYKRGQIDQKYTDKAKIEKQTKEMI